MKHGAPQDRMMIGLHACAVHEELVRKRGDVAPATTLLTTQAPSRTEPRRDSRSGFHAGLSSSKECEDLPDAGPPQDARTATPVAKGGRPDVRSDGREN